MAKTSDANGPPANPLLTRFKNATPQPRVAIVSRGRRLGDLIPAQPPVPASELEKLSAWRNLHRTAFFSERQATPQSTARWLEGIASRSDRLLFLITSGCGDVVGHIGLNHVDEPGATAETDAWLGVGDKRVPGMMLYAFASLLRWTFDYLRLSVVNAQVFADNAKVIRAHEMLGFRSDGQVAFRRCEDASGAWWEAGPGPAQRPVARLQLLKPHFDALADKWL